MVKFNKEPEYLVEYQSFDNSKSTQNSGTIIYLGDNFTTRIIYYLSLYVLKNLFEHKFVVH